jgi:putative membrane protein
MIEAHTASTGKPKAAAAAASPAIVPDPAMSADQQQKVDALKAQSGAAFDALYIDDQIAAHEQALDGLRSYAATGDDVALKKVSTELTPKVTAHLNMAKGLKH